MHEVFSVRSEPTAEAWFAAIFDRNRLGMAIAAIIRMIATTIKSSMSEKPFCFLPIIISLQRPPPIGQKQPTKKSLLIRSIYFPLQVKSTAPKDSPETGGPHQSISRYL